MCLLVVYNFANRLTTFAAKLTFSSVPASAQVFSALAAVVFVSVLVAVSGRLVVSGPSRFPLSLPATSQTDLPPCPLRQNDLEIIIQRVFIGSSRSGF